MQEIWKIVLKIYGKSLTYWSGGFVLQQNRNLKLQYVKVKPNFILLDPETICYLCQFSERNLFFIY